METDNQYFKRMDDEAERESAIEAKAEEIQTTLLSNDSFRTHSKISIDIIDFFADFEVEGDTLTEFLKENSTYGNGQYLRKEITEALEKYCYDLAVEEIYNEVQDEPF